MRGDQTLADLHHALFDAFGRWEEHLYEFQFGKGPMDRQGPRYVLPSALQSESGEDKPQIDLLARGARWGSMGSAALHDPIIPRPAHVVKGSMRGQHRSCGKHQLLDPFPGTETTLEADLAHGASRSEKQVGRNDPCPCGSGSSRSAVLSFFVCAQQAHKWTLKHQG
jgi:hypothetical protein